MRAPERAAHAGVHRDVVENERAGARLLDAQGRAVLGAEARGQHRVGIGAGKVERAAGRDVGERGDDARGLDARDAVLDRHVDVERRGAAEERVELVGGERGELGVEVGGDAAAGLGGGEAGRAAHHGAVVELQREVGGEVGEGAARLQREVDAGLALERQQLGDDAARRLLQIEVDVDLAARLVDRDGGGEAGRDGVGALRLERGLDERGVARQLGRARQRQLHVLADERLSEVERVDAQLLDAGRDELGRIAGFFRRRRREGCARDGDLARGDEVDLDLVAQERERAPVELQPLDGQPGAFGILQLDALDLDVAVELHVEPGDLDQPAVGRQRLADQPLDIGLRVLRDDHRRREGRSKSEGGREGEGTHHQKACPMPT